MSEYKYRLISEKWQTSYAGFGTPFLDSQGLVPENILTRAQGSHRERSRRKATVTMKTVLDGTLGGAVPANRALSQIILRWHRKNFIASLLRSWPSCGWWPIYIRLWDNQAAQVEQVCQSIFWILDSLFSCFGMFSWECLYKQSGIYCNQAYIK